MDHATDAGEIQVKLDHLYDLERQLSNMNQSCNKARQLVIQTVKELTSKIGEHERTLLDEIEMFRHSQRKKYRTIADQCSALIQQLQGDVSAAREPDAVSAGLDERLEDGNEKNCVDNNYGSEANDCGGNGRGEDRRDEARHDLVDENDKNLQRVAFCPALCSAAFGSIDVIEWQKRDASYSRQGKSMSLCYSKLLQKLQTNIAEE